MEKAAAVKFHIFKTHEQKYMLEKLWNTRPWAFLNSFFPRPPKQTVHQNVSIDGGNYYIVSQKLSSKESFTYKSVIS